MNAAAVVSLRSCAACGKPAQGNATIHRDGFGEGPEVDLCDDCGTHEFPGCETLWVMIRERNTAREQGGN
jgi:hypothetical protein